MRSRSHVVALSLVALVATAPSTARAQTPSRRIELGGGLAVTRDCTTSRAISATSCFGWTPVGFSFGDSSLWLTYAWTFARVPIDGSIIAIAGRASDGVVHMRPPRMLRSVDGGRHWTEVSWSGTLRPLILAFDHTSAY